MSFDNCCDKAAQKIRYMALPFFSTLLLGLAAHMYMLTNKISFGEDITSIFNKAATVVSGRWGLELVQWMMPDISMPWFNGLFSLVLVSIAVCMAIELFGIKNRVLQLMLGGFFICSPAESATLCYVFTCAPYALSLLMAVCAVYIFENWGSRLRWAVSAVLLMLSCSMYQAYFATAASFCVLIMIKQLLDKKEARHVFFHGLKLFIMLVLGLALYGASVPLMAKLAGLPVLDVINDEQSILLRLAVAYSAYIKTFIKGYFAYVNTAASMLAHLGLVAFAAWLAAKDMLSTRDRAGIALTALLVLLFPLSCYCLYLISDNGYIHTLALFPFTSLYVLLAIIFERYVLPGEKFRKTAVFAAMAVILFSNILFANQLHFRSYIQYESRVNFYTSLMAVVTQTEGFDEGVKLAIVGEQPAAQTDFEQHFRLSGFQHPSYIITDPTHAQGFINNVLGYELPFAGEEELAALAQDAGVQAMPVYPYHGSVKRVGDCMVVRLADN